MTTTFSLMIYSNFPSLIHATFYLKLYSTLKGSYTKKKNLVHPILEALNGNKTYITKELLKNDRQQCAWFWQPWCGTVKSHLPGHKPNNTLKISRSTLASVGLDVWQHNHKQRRKDHEWHFKKYRKVFTQCDFVCRLCTVQQCGSSIPLSSDWILEDTVLSLDSKLFCV